MLAAKEREPVRLHSLLCPGILLRHPVNGGAAEIQMVLRRIHSPLQDPEEEGHERGKRGEPGEKLPKAARR